MIDGDAISRFKGSFLRGKKLRLVLVGPGLGGGLERARVSLTMLSATDPGETLGDRRVVGLQMVVRPGDGGGLEGPGLLVIAIDDVE